VMPPNAAPAESRARRKQRRAKKSAETYASYVVAIEDWGWSFDFGVNATPRDDEAYWDFRHLTLRGKLLIPSRIKAETVELTLMPGRDAEARDAGRERPKGIGGVHLHGDRFVAYLGMPRDALAPVLQMLVAGKSKFIVLDGERLWHRRAMIRHFRLETHVDEEDMAEDQRTLRYLRTHLTR
jgi:hypothetical protein